MRSFTVLALLAVSFGLVAITEAQIILAAGIIIAAKAIALGFAKGAIVGCGVSGCFNRGGRGGRGGFGGRRYGRSAEVSYNMHDLIVSTSVQDSEDCVKKMVCMINAKPAEFLSEDERAILNTFGVDGELDVSMPSVEFDVAALIGRRVGAGQCNTVYARCPYKTEQLLETLKTPLAFNDA
jgi:hypothetical protein